MGCQEDGCEAEEGGQAGGISAAAFAVSVEDVDLGWLKMEADIDPNHGPGPGEEAKRAGVEQGGRLSCCGPGERWKVRWEQKL